MKKMKVLLLGNVTPKHIASYVGETESVVGGWFHSLIDDLWKQKSIELIICFYYVGEEREFPIVVNGISYYGFTKKIKTPTKYDFTVEDQFSRIIQKEKPDIVHIFGTEYPHSLAMVNAFHRPDRTVIHIQGLLSFYYIHFDMGIPRTFYNYFTVRDFLRQDNIRLQQRKFYQRGIYEVEAIQKVGHVTGRTNWDEACCYQINPGITYHCIQETMRESFYSGKWIYDKCEKHTIFMSQGGYPIKGLHFAIKALAILKKRWCDVRLYVAGTDICDFSSVSHKLKRSSYQIYIKKLICQYGVEENIIFTGALAEKQMKDMYLRCNVFVSASTIENSPNSIGEAMLLGTPIVASDVGGVSSLLKHEDEGYLYPVDEPYMLAYYVSKMFENSEMAVEIGRNAAKKAHENYNRNQVIKKIVEMYRVMGENNE